MNPLYVAFAASAARWVVTIAASQGVALADDQATQIVSGVIAVAMLAWSWLKAKKQDRDVKLAAKTGVVP
jgi:hypothetical protein